MSLPNSSFDSSRRSKTTTRVGFFDLPLELRAIIWSMSVKASKHTSRYGNSDYRTMRVTFPDSEDDLYFSSSDAASWLNNVNSVSEAFAEEGRPYFFRYWHFEIYEALALDTTISSDDAIMFERLQRFLQGAGPDARHIKQIVAHHGHYRRLGPEKAIARLNEMDLGGLKMPELVLRLHWARNLREQPPKGQFRLHAPGDWRLMS